MSESTFSERVEEDRITAKYIYHGEQVSYYADPTTGNQRLHRCDHWTVVLFRPDNEVLQDGRLVDGAHRLGGPAGEIGHTIVLTYSMSTLLRKSKRKEFNSEAIRPTIAEVLSAYCQDVCDIENGVTFEGWFEETTSEIGQKPLLADYRVWENLCRYRDEFKRFLGSKFEEYINNTEWE